MTTIERNLIAYIIRTRAALRARRTAPIVAAPRTSVATWDSLYTSDDNEPATQRSPRFATTGGDR